MTSVIIICILFMIAIPFLPSSIDKSVELQKELDHLYSIDASNRQIVKYVIFNVDSIGWEKMGLKFGSEYKVVNEKDSTFFDNAKYQILLNDKGIWLDKNLFK